MMVLAERKAELEMSADANGKVARGIDPRRGIAKR
jgi:hypothetical protein